MPREHLLMKVGPLSRTGRVIFILVILFSWNIRRVGLANGEEHFLSVRLVTFSRVQTVNNEIISYKKDFSMV